MFFFFMSVSHENIFELGFQLPSKAKDNVFFSSSLGARAISARKRAPIFSDEKTVFAQDYVPARFDDLSITLTETISRPKNGKFTTLAKPNISIAHKRCCTYNNSSEFSPIDKKDDMTIRNSGKILSYLILEKNKIFLSRVQIINARSSVYSLHRTILTNRIRTVLLIIIHLMISSSYHTKKLRTRILGGFDLRSSYAYFTV